VSKNSKKGDGNTLTVAIRVEVTREIEGDGKFASDDNVGAAHSLIVDGTNARVDGQRLL